MLCSVNQDIILSLIIVVFNVLFSFQDLVTFVQRQIEEQSMTIKEQAKTNEKQSAVIQVGLVYCTNKTPAVWLFEKKTNDKCFLKNFLSNQKLYLIYLLKLMIEKIEQQEALIKELITRGTEEESDNILKREDSKCSPKPKTSSEGFFFWNTPLLCRAQNLNKYKHWLFNMSSSVDLTQNATIEERVSLLEVLVVEIQEDITGLGVDLTGLDEDVGFLFDEQVIQDERLLNLEIETKEIDEQLITVDDDLESKFCELIFFSTNSSRFSVVFCSVSQ